MSASTEPLLDRDVADDNFADTVSLLGACAAWAEGIEVGHRVSHSDRNMIQIPVELALAFAKLHASDQTPLGEAVRSSVDMLRAMRRAVK